MCKFIKENGEQCGIDSHDGDYCHLHDDVDSTAADSDVESVELRDDVTHCDECKTTVRPAVLDITGAAFKPKMAHVKQGLVCDCESVRFSWNSQTIEKSQLPDSWL